jgi:hypothetical protein
MRTTVTLQDTLLKDLLQYAHTKKMGEAINMAIREWIRIKKINEIKALHGRLSIDDNLKTLRQQETKKLKKWSTHHE